MKRGLLTRRLAAAILISVATLTIAVFAPLVYGLRIEDAARLGTSVFASQADTVLIASPLRLSAAPDVMLSSATLVAAHTLPGRNRAVKLIAPGFVVSLGGHDAGAAPQNASEAVQLLAPLLEQFSGTGIDTVALQGGTIELKWGAGQALTLSGIDAQILIRGKANLAAKGQFEYRGQAVTFDAVSAPMQQPMAISPDLVVLPDLASTAHRASVWPLRLTLTSAPLDVAFDGAVDLGGGVKLAGTALLSTQDATKTARWLGHGWRGRVGGLALRINGPVQWSEGVVALGKSVVSLNDQTGSGAISLSYRDERPLIEASLAFPALDVAPFLLSEPATIVPAVLLKMAGSVVPSSKPAWRTLATSFPALASIDVDWRLSAEHLQWQGEPVGSAAVSVTARDGKLSADFAELDVGAHRGTLQISSDSQPTNPAVSVRGQFRSTHAGTLITEIFGAGVATSALTTQFEIAGVGATVGDIIQTARGQGSLDSPAGTWPVDLSAMQSMARSAAVEAPGAAWGPILGRSQYSGLIAKWQLRDGLFVVDHAQAQSGGLLATMQGQVGTSSNELDLLVRVAPVTAGGVARTSSPRSRTAAAKDTLAIHGSKDRPIFSPIDLDRAP